MFARTQISLSLSLSRTRARARMIKKYFVPSPLYRATFRLKIRNCTVAQKSRDSFNLQQSWTEYINVSQIRCCIKQNYYIFPVFEPNIVPRFYRGARYIWRYETREKIQKQKGNEEYRKNDIIRGAALSDKARRWKSKRNGWNCLSFPFFSSRFLFQQLAWIFFHDDESYECGRIEEFVQAWKRAR